MAAVFDDAVSIAAEIAELRRAIHREPELGLDLPKTQEKVLAALAGLPLEIATGRALSSVTAVLRGGRAGASGRGDGAGGPARTVLLRADMDALPLTERTGVPYSSRVDGVMHACGHDLHTAMLVGAARLLCARQAELAGDVIFMFQPGEEERGGARIMIEEGVLDVAGERPVAAYGLHVASSLLPRAWWTGRPGPMMAAGDTLRVTVHGRGGHGSRPDLAADPIPAACEMVTALQAMVTRKFNVFDPVVVTVGSFHAGTVDNVIPDTATFAATVRSFSAQARDLVRESSLRLVTDVASAHGLTADADFEYGYPVTVNNAAELAFAEQTIAAALGPDRFIETPTPITGSEDFSFVLEQVPGAFVMLGACPPDADAGTAPFNHSAEAVFDDGILADGTAVYAELALRRLTDDGEAPVTP